MRRLLMALLLLGGLPALGQPTVSDEEIFFVFQTDTTGGTGTDYTPILGPLGSPTDEDDAVCEMTSSGTVKRLAVYRTGGAGGGATFTVTVRHDSGAGFADTSMFCTMSGFVDNLCTCPGSGEACGNTDADDITFAAGDKLTIKGVCTAGTCGAKSMRGSLALQMDQLGTQILCGGNNDGDLTIDSNGWYSFGGQANVTSSSESANQIVFPFGGRLRDLRVLLESDAAGSGATLTWTVYQNGGATDLDCSIVGTKESDLSCTNSSDEVDLVHGDLIAMKATVDAGTLDATAGIHASFSANFVHSKRGHFIMPCSTRTALDTAATDYYLFPGGDCSKSSSFLNNTRTGVTGFGGMQHFEITGLLMDLNVAPGASKSWNADLQKRFGFGAPADTGHSLTLTGASATFDEDWTPADYDIDQHFKHNLALKIVPTFTPASSRARWTVVGRAIDPIQRRVYGD